jgi:LL-diaminopimelate aminotransferase
MAFAAAERLGQLPPYLFADIDRRKRDKIAAGYDVIDFGVGDPDLPTPRFILDALATAASDPANHRYPMGIGISRYRAAVAAWFERRFGVSLDPQREVLGLIGSKEGIGHLPVACLNAGDIALIPSPGYPVYHSGTLFAGGTPYEMPLSAERNWLPDLTAIPDEVARRAKLMFLNYPNNPTGAVAPLSFYEEALSFARRHDVLIVQDAAYSEVAFGEAPPSLFQLNDSRDHVIEFYSLSKTYNMTGWRLAFAVGHATALAALAKVKANMDSGQFAAVQLAGAAALDHADHPDVQTLLEMYRQRGERLADGLCQLGLQARAPVATFYLWMPVPDGLDSMGLASRLLDEAQVTVIPGVGFGATAEGFVRFSLTVPDARIDEALARMQSMRF